MGKTSFFNSSSWNVDIGCIIGVGVGAVSSAARSM
jgi:hypothetical protein